MPLISPGDAAVGAVPVHEMATELLQRGLELLREETLVVSAAGVDRAAAVGVARVIGVAGLPPLAATRRISVLDGGVVLAGRPRLHEVAAA